MTEQELIKEELTEEEKNKIQKFVPIYPFEDGDILTYNEVNTICEGFLKTSTESDVLYTEITYSELVSLRDTSGLTPGMQYRLTDYECTVANDTNARAINTGHFDIILVADDETTLNENVRFTHNENDTYFVNSNLSAWEGKYCLDNDTDKYAWADSNQFALEDKILLANDFDENDLVVSTNGRGVIYWLKDEWNNECPYDFKNIQFRRVAISNIDATGITSDMLSHLRTTFVYNENGGICYGQVNGVPSNVSYTTTYNNITINYTFDNTKQKYYYTFTWVDGSGGVQDASIVGQQLTNPDGQYPGVFNNEIQSVSQHKFNPYSPNEFGYSLNDIVFVSSYSYTDGVFYGYYGNKFGVNCYRNTFGNGCYNNTFGNGCYNNTFGNSCYGNTFVNDCYYNTFGNSCSYCVFGNNCRRNTFGMSCFQNTFGNGCFQNTFGNGCGNNTFEKKCYCNIFGNNCEYNTFGNNCSYCVFGNSCYQNTFGNSCGGNTFGNYCESNTFGNYCSRNTFGNSCNSDTFENHCVDNSLGDGCYYNTFGNDCEYISLGDGCYYNTFGKNCYYNTFGNYCESNTFGNNCENNSFENNYIKQCRFGDGVQYCTISGIITGSSKYIQNYHFLSNVTSYTLPTDSLLNITYQLVVGRKSDKSIIMVNPMD